MLVCSSISKNSVIEATLVVERGNADKVMAVCVGQVY